MIKSWSDVQRGVEVRAVGGDEATVIYNGLLHKSGADYVYLHVGYGSPNYWTNVQTLKMDRTPRGWEKTIKIMDGQANICFKDSANNWDNNSGYNWVIH